MKNLKKYMMEGVGAMFWLFAYALIGGPFAVAGMVTVLIYLGSPISGGHFNPAMSLAMWIRGKLNKCDLIWYMIFQLLGGLFGSLAVWGISGNRFVLAPIGHVDYWKIFSIELIFTFFLVFVFLSFMTSKKVKVNHHYGMIIGLAVLTIAVMGGTYNPALQVGPHIIDALAGGSVLRYMPFHLFGSLIGGALAAAAFIGWYPEEFK